MKFRAVSVFAFTCVLFFAAATTARAEIFFAYLNSAQEVPTNASPATGYARIFLNESALTINYTIVYNGLQGTWSGTHIHAPAAIGANSGVVVNFPGGTGNSGTLTGTTAITATQIAQLRQGLGYVNVHSSPTFPGGEIRGQLAKKRPIDFAGDGRNDYSVLRFPAAGDPRPMTWWNLNSTTGPQTVGPYFNALTDFPAPGDYDGDGKDDFAIFRAGVAASPQAAYWIIKSSDFTLRYFAWGLMGDLNVARDFDGDGITDPAAMRRGAAGSQAVVHPSQHRWHGTGRTIRHERSGR